MKKRYWFGLFLLALPLTYMLGPKVAYPKIDATIQPLSIPLTELDAYIAQKEQNVSNLKPDNEARIVWADSIRQTPYSMVYLHGFSASQKEGAPIHEELAKRFGCNLYLARLAQHGIEDRETFKNITPKDFVDSAKEAIAIGNLLGEKVIVLSCSTGGTLSAYLAATNPDWIAAQLLFAPNFGVNAAGMELLTAPWGKQLARTINGSEYWQLGMSAEAYSYWTKEYRFEGIIALQALIEEVATATVFSKITQPSFIGYYYKNEDEKDEVISIPAIHRFYETIQTPVEQKRKITFPDAEAHVVLSDLVSQDLDSPREESIRFLEEVVFGESQ